MYFTPNILIIDDEIEIGVFFRRLLENKGFQVAVANSHQVARELWSKIEFHAALIDLKLPDTDGLQLLQELKKVQPSCEVIIMTGYATTRTAVKAVQLGAFDYIEKPFDDIREIEQLIQKVLKYKNEKLSNTIKPEWAEIATKVGLYYGKNQKLHQLLTIAEKIAKKNINVLIHGETGTGKEVLARFIHQASTRAKNKFIAVNCGAVPENLLESHLFGHEKGAFTGASETHQGIFELANNGTLFLDEIGEASPAIQVKLLRVLETGEFLRVGGERTIKTNVRLLAATNIDLEQAVLDKKFREDLFYRLDVVRLLLPTLRERKADIPGLIQHFLKRLGVKENKLKLSDEVYQILQNYSWPGNLRELFNTLTQAVALCDGKIILKEHLPSKILEPNPQKIKALNNSLQNLSLSDAVLIAFDNLKKQEFISTQELMNSYQTINDLKIALEKILHKRGIATTTPVSLRDLEAKALRDALILHKGSVTASAKALGISRSTFYRKAKQYGIELDN